MCAFAEPFPAATELDLLEEGNLLVVAGCGLVPPPLLPRGRSLAGPRRGGAGHDGGPSRRAGLGGEQSVSEAAAPMTPIVTCRTRPLAARRLATGDWTCRMRQGAVAGTR